jgi:hypothetical protein
MHFSIVNPLCRAAGAENFLSRDGGPTTTK